jgi:hypothetical protein
MKIHVIRNRAAPEQIREMLEELETQNNRGMEIEDPELRTKMEVIIRRLLEAEST